MPRTSRKALAGKGPTRRRITVLLPAADYARLSKHCAETGHKKSTLIERLVRAHLDEHEPLVRRKEKS